MSNKKAWGITADRLFSRGRWDGLLTDGADACLDMIREYGEFRPRSEIEDDPAFKQIIPQIILRYKDTYLLHRISASGGEQRLHDLWPVFIGGHVDEIDASRLDIVEAALERELEEEVTINGDVTSREFLGIIYIEDENPVNHVHVGLTYLFEINTDDVTSNEDALADLQFVNTRFLLDNIERLTYWSRLVVKKVLAV
ncbi:MAG: hypothetical protein TR69_WS6001001517 [candidate division WS6 bacterium OLB20]|uniref:Nudix hydrolase domain-containing protein n=1 Tax=candidate division WS6 bacterium OLB20 TaxID=1617426 RepID=A0A136LVM3_9BACT|nr:MAG: hypothetical protein TR69_WS6001001517 [candidate division WS6 bacterium OLB20]